MCRENRHKTWKTFLVTMLTVCGWWWLVWPQCLVGVRQDSTWEERVLFFVCLLIISITSQSVKPTLSGISLSLHCSATKRQSDQIVVTDDTQKQSDPKASLSCDTSPCYLSCSLCYFPSISLCLLSFPSVLFSPISLSPSPATPKG